VGLPGSSRKRQEEDQEVKGRIKGLGGPPSSFGSLSPPGLPPGPAQGSQTNLRTSLAQIYFIDVLDLAAMV
jgi:hypothetical protein